MWFLLLIVALRRNDRSRTSTTTTLHEHEHNQINDSIRHLKGATEKSFEEVKDDLAVLNSSARIFGKLLEHYLLERIERLEKVLRLSPYVPNISEDEQ